MCFGLTNAPRTFQRTISLLLEGLDFVKIFLDDILIFSKTVKEHQTHVEIVCDRLKKAGATISLEKSKFCLKEIEYLGHVINATGIKPLDRGIDKLELIKPPTTVKQLQRLLELLNWFRPFI